MEKQQCSSVTISPAVLVFLSLAAGSAAASAAETGIKTMPDMLDTRDCSVSRSRIVRSMGIAGSTIMPDRVQATALTPEYDDQWDPNIWSTGNGYY